MARGAHKFGALKVRKGLCSDLKESNKKSRLKCKQVG